MFPGVKGGQDAFLAVWGPGPSLAPEDDFIPVQRVHLLHIKAEIIALWRPLPVSFCPDSFAMLC